MREHRRELQNLILKSEFDEVSKIDEAISALQNIRSLDEKPSIALEKWVTIGLHIINDAVKIKPNYLVDDDNNVVFTAPGNRPDIECFYQEFNSICEVTLLTDKSQWFNEGQPVMRHLRDFEIKNNDNSFCLFLAPRIHRDTFNTFSFSNKYEYEGEKQRIVPLSITQFLKILQRVLMKKKENKPITHDEFRVLLEKLYEIATDSKDLEDWAKKSNTILDKFQNEGIVA